MSEFQNGWLEIKRTSQYFSYFRSFDLYVDEKVVGTVKNGERKVIEYPPGDYQVRTQIDWCKSQTHNVCISPGETTKLITGSDITGLKIFFAVIYLFMPDKMIYLRSSANNLIS